MALLQPKLNLKVSQKQILTPGLVQMVSVLALNKLELADMINAELTENPVLEELDEMRSPAGRGFGARRKDGARQLALATQEQPAATTPEEKDPFDEIDFGSFFSEYLDPGMRTSIEMEESEKPSFENFLSKPTTLTDHLMWQLGSLHVDEDVYRAAELVIGNLNEEGYLTASDDELLGLAGGNDSAGVEAAAEVQRCAAAMWIFAASSVGDGQAAPVSAWDWAIRGSRDGTTRVHVMELVARRSRMSEVRSGGITVQKRQLSPPAPAAEASPSTTLVPRGPRRRACHSAAMRCAKLSTWSSRWIPSGLARAICASACWPSSTI